MSLKKEATGLNTEEVPSSSGPVTRRKGVLDGIEETGAPHHGEQHREGDHRPDPVAVAIECQHAATVWRLARRHWRVESVLDHAVLASISSKMAPAPRTTQSNGSSET